MQEKSEIDRLSQSIKRRQAQISPLLVTEKYSTTTRKCIYVVSKPHIQYDIQLLRKISVAGNLFALLDCNVVM